MILSVTGVTIFSSTIEVIHSHCFVIFKTMKNNHFLYEISLFISSLSPKNNSRMTKAELTYVIFDVKVRLRNFLGV
jgi:hypothetical protein